MAQQVFYDANGQAVHPGDSATFTGKVTSYIPPKAGQKSGTIVLTGKYDSTVTITVNANLTTRAT